VERILSSYRCVQEASHDPEHTCTVALTQQDTAVVALGLRLAIRLCPELEEEINDLALKINEVATAQSFWVGEELDD
jgi:hypothetical protein